MKKYIIALCLAVMLLAGCGSNTEEIEKYRTDMDNILSQIASVDSELNSLDPENEQSMNMLLLNLDKLDGLFKQMSELDYPEGFEQIKKLSVDASNDMSMSVARFHDAYDGEYNEEAQSEAYDLYQDANQKLRVLIQVLRGEYNNSSADDEKIDAEEPVTDAEPASDEEPDIGEEIAK